MRQDKLEKDDFTEEMQPFLSMVLCGPGAEKRRKKFLASPYEVLGGNAKLSVIVHCTDDDYRFDFLQTSNAWRLSFIECITLPVAGISALPYFWVPFYDDRLSYIAYAAWMENRIYGEHVEIIKFDEKCCCLRFCGHLWRRMYAMTGHIREMIDYEEYMDIFEAIWQDRASANGWLVEFCYDEELPV